MADIDNQDLEHQREPTPEKGARVKPTRVSPFDAKELEHEDEKAEEAVRKLEESLTKLPPG